MLSVSTWFLWAESKMLKCLTQIWTLGGSTGEHCCDCVCRRDWQNAPKDKEHHLRPGKNSMSRDNSRGGEQTQKLLEGQVPDDKCVIFLIHRYPGCTAQSSFFAALTMSTHFFGSLTLLCHKKTNDLLVKGSSDLPENNDTVDRPTVKSLCWVSQCGEIRVTRAAAKMCKIQVLTWKVLNTGHDHLNYCACVCHQRQEWEEWVKLTFLVP